MSKRPVVLFLCTHNAGRSLAARVLLEHYALGDPTRRTIFKRLRGKSDT